MVDGGTTTAENIVSFYLNVVWAPVGLLARGYTGKIWIFNHEPWYLFYPFLENSTRTTELKKDPEFMRRTWGVSWLVQSGAQGVAPL